MFKKIATILVACAIAQSTLAQTISTFENLTLPANSYLNGAAVTSGITTFNSGNAAFVNAYDTSFGGYWGACSISNITDSANGTFGNQYASAAYGGYDASNNYATMYIDYNQANNKIKLTGTALGKVVAGTYITNSTWAYKYMKTGINAYGGANGTKPDYFRVHFTGWYNGIAKTDTVVFALADFTDANNANDYVVNDWRWCNLSTLGNVDSLTYWVSSSDTGQFGINTPAYFCIDNFTTNDAALSIESMKTIAVSLYPNPASAQLFVNNITSSTIKIHNAFGQLVKELNALQPNVSLDINNLIPGVYYLQLEDQRIKFIKQ